MPNAHHEAHDALAGGGSRRGELEDHGIEPVQHEEEDVEEAAAETAADGEHAGTGDQKDRADRCIDQEGRGADRKSGGAYRDRDTLRGLRGENGVDRRIQAWMTIVSAM